MIKLKEKLNELSKKYSMILAKAKIELIALKKESDPKLRVLKGMEALPALKERILLTKLMLDDIKAIQESLND